MAFELALSYIEQHHAVPLVASHCVEDASAHGQVAP